MAEFKRKVANSVRSNSGGRSGGSGKIADIAVEIVSYDTSSKNRLEHSMIVKPIGDLKDNTGKLIVESGKEIKVFMPPENEIVDGKKVEKQVRSRRDVMGLKGKTAMGYSTGDAMPPGSIVGLSKLWASEVGEGDNKVTVINANYGEGLLHPDAMVMNTKNPPPEDGEEPIQDGLVTTGLIFGSDCAISALPVYAKKDEATGAESISQRMRIIMKGESSPVEGTLEAIAEKIDEQINRDGGDLGIRGILLVGYKRAPEGATEAELKEFASDPNTRVAVPVLAPPYHDTESDEWFEPSGELAVKINLLEKENDYIQDVVKSLSTGEWDFVSIPLAQFGVMPSLIPGHENNKLKVDFTRACAVVEADVKVDEAGNPILNDKGYKIFTNPEVMEHGFVDLKYAVVNRNVSYYHENGARMTGDELKISWREKKELISENNGYCSVGQYANISNIKLNGSNFSPAPSYFSADVVVKETPSYMVAAIEEEKKDSLGKKIAYNQQLKAAAEAKEKKSEASDPQP